MLPGLFASAPAGLSFAPSLAIRAFLLQRRQGNLLVYSAATVADDGRAVEEQGGIARHYLNHWHEATFGGGDRIAATFERPAALPRERARGGGEDVPVAGTFNSRHMAAATSS